MYDGLPVRRHDEPSTDLERHHTLKFRRHYHVVDGGPRRFAHDASASL